MENLFSFFILILLFYGRSLGLKHKKKAHVKWMFVVIALDLLLVLFLSIKRQALGKVSSDMPWTLMVHLPFAIGCVLGYLASIYYGMKLYHGQERYRSTMKRLDRFIVVFRVMTFLTSLAYEYF
ncbi:MAG: hypothetical protein D6797_03845 [Bdellovibrio sp.]|nr:MAG: hypothetical protein D6797_03845 [Bdellovibrio sp.]